MALYPSRLKPGNGLKAGSWKKSKKPPTSLPPSGRNWNAKKISWSENKENCSKPNAIPLNLLKEEQGQIADALAAIDRQLDLHDTHFDGVKSKLNKALELLEGCGEVYRAAPEHIKRAFNQAFFEKIYVSAEDGTCEVKPLFAEPYGLIFGQKAQSGAEAEAEIKSEAESPANLRGIGELARHFNEWRNRRIFLGGGFSKNLVVENSGIEPLTS